MIEEENTSNDKSRRTFLKALGVTGAATATLGTFSDNVAATATTRSITPLDIKADNIVPANKHLSITILDDITKEIEKANVLVNDTQVSSVQQTGKNTFLLSVFDILTNTDLMNSETVPIKLQAKTTDGSALVGTDVVNVVDPTNVLDETTGQVNDTFDSTGLIGETTDDVVDTADSVGLLNKVSGDNRSQAQMY